ncbi:hypothetical protein ACCI51_08310 [Microbulbifer echini]|uniref:Uncharacterized protein n=1 Tax=Microbulbifer echini TaxID=1529067 RepID=A0ABV4NNE0_9GAMM|nr:hypothetical protein [uncultured Microbulbifer sp.]
MASMKNSKLLIFSLFLLASTGSSSVKACLFPEPLDFDYIENADAIFIGHVSKFIYFDRNPVAKTASYSLISFEVESYLLGDDKEYELDAFWQDYSYMPENFEQGRYLVAVKGEALPSAVLANQPYSIGSKAVKYRILQDPCRPAFVLKPSSENLHKVNEVVDGMGTIDIVQP